LAALADLWINAFATRLVPDIGLALGLEICLGRQTEVARVVLQVFRLGVLLNGRNFASDKNLTDLSTMALVAVGVYVQIVAV
jgi:hypothetical protein